MVVMTTPADIKAIFASLSGRKITATDIADTLGVSRNSANTRLKNGLDAEDIITVSHGLGINPVDALIELKKLTRDEVWAHLDSDGTMLATASIEQLVYRLAEDTLSAVEKVELGAEARAFIERNTPKRPHLAAVPDTRVDPSDYDDGTVRDFDYDESEYAADSSPDEQKIREERGEDPID